MIAYQAIYEQNSSNQTGKQMNIVYSYFALDIVHRGHLLMMKNAKQIAGPNGRLIVGIVADEAVIKQKGRAPILSFSERLEISLSVVLC